MQFAETMKIDEKPLTFHFRFGIIDMLGSLYPAFCCKVAKLLDKEGAFAYNINILFKPMIESSNINGSLQRVAFGGKRQ